MSEHEKLLDEALKTQFEDVDSGSDGQKKKESVETLKILYELKMAQEKANQDSELKESEMVLKEREMDLKEIQANEELSIKKQELLIKERELAIRKSESLMKKIEVGASIGTGIVGMKLYQKNFNKIYKFETDGFARTVDAGRALSYLRNIEKLAIQGVRISVFKH